MSALEPKKFSDLSEADKRFIRDLRLRETTAPQDWVARFATLCAFDDEGDKKRGRIAYTALVFLLATVFAGIYGEIWGAGFFTPVLAAPGVPFLGLTIWWFVASQADIPDELREFIFPVVRRLSEQYASGHPMQLHLDLRPFIEWGNVKTDKRPHDRYAEVKTWKHTWFSGTMPLHDGSTLTWSINDEITRFSTYDTERETEFQFETKREFLVSVAGRARRDVRSADAEKVDPAQDGERKRLWTQNKGLPAVPPVDTFLSLVGDAHRASRVRAPHNTRSSPS